MMHVCALESDCRHMGIPNIWIVNPDRRSDGGGVPLSRFAPAMKIHGQSLESPEREVLMSNQRRLNLIFLRAMTDGCTGAGFFGRVSWPDDSREPIATQIIEEHLRGKDLTVEGQKSRDDAFAATTQAMEKAMATEYKYAMAGLTVGFGVALSVIGGSVFLTAKGHPNVAVGLLGGAIFGIIGLILKARFGA